MAAVRRAVRVARLLPAAAAIPLAKVLPGQQDPQAADLQLVLGQLAEMAGLSAPWTIRLLPVVAVAAAALVAIMVLPVVLVLPEVTQRPVILGQFQNHQEQVAPVALGVRL
jgi:hypothetical protein